MKLRKQIIIAIILFISLCFLNFSTFSQYFDKNIIINYPIKPGDTLVKNVIQIYSQIQKSNGNNISRLDSLVQILDPNIKWRCEGVIGYVPFAGDYETPLGVQTFWKNFFRSIVIHKIELRYYLRQGNKIHLHWFDEGIVKSTGKRFSMETVQVWEFNDMGALVSFKWYNDTFAMWNAFQHRTDPQLSLVQHPQDYYIYVDSTVNDPIALVKTLYADFKYGNVPDILSHTSDDLVIVFAGPKINPFAGIYYGKSGLIQWLTNMVVNYRFDIFNQYSFICDGGKVDIEWEESFIAYPQTATGKKAYLHGLHSIFINSRGEMVKFRSYNDTYICAWAYTKEYEENRW